MVYLSSLLLPYTITYVERFFRGRSNTEQDLQRLDGNLPIIRSRTKRDCICSNRKVTGERRDTKCYCDTGTDKPGIHTGECFEKYEAHIILLILLTSIYQ